MEELRSAEEAVEKLFASCQAVCRFLIVRLWVRVRLGFLCEGSVGLEGFYKGSTRVGMTALQDQHKGCRRGLRVSGVCLWGFWAFGVWSFHVGRTGWGPGFVGLRVRVAGLLWKARPHGGPQNPKPKSIEMIKHREKPVF